MNFCYTYWNILHCYWLALSFWTKISHYFLLFPSRIQIFICRSYVVIVRFPPFSSSRSLCLFDRDNSHEKLMRFRLGRGQVGVGVGVECPTLPALSLFWISRGGLSAPLAGLCLLGMACNQLLSLSLSRRLGWVEERRSALSLCSQHVREKPLPRTPRENTDTNTASPSHHVWFTWRSVGLSEGLCREQKCGQTVLIVRQWEQPTHYWIFDITKSYI